MTNGKHIVFWLSFLVSFISRSDHRPFDNLQIKHYSYENYRGGPGNYMGLTAPDGMLYFANSAGILIFDGSEWQLLRMSKPLGVTALHLSGQRLYFGGYQVLGYVELRPEHPVPAVQLLTDLIPDNKKVGDIWQIIETPAGIYFQSYNDIFFYNGKQLIPLGLPNCHLFKLDNWLMASDFDGKLYRITGTRSKQIYQLPDVYHDAVFGVEKYSYDEHILFTSENGAFILNSRNKLLRRWESAFNDSLISYRVYYTTTWQDSLFLCTTWNHGFFVFDHTGSVLYHAGRKEGLPDSGLREVFTDIQGNLWLPSNSGIYQLKFTNGTDSSSFVPVIRIKGISSELGRLVQIKNIYDPQYLIFEFATPGFNRDELEYAFYLEGYDRNWTPWSRIYKKEYTGLGHGQYTFHVKARVINNGQEIAPASLSFGIKMPLLKRPGILTLIGLMCGLLVFALLRLRYKELQQARAELETKVVERTAQLMKEQEKLSRLNRELLIANSELDNFVYRSSHDLIAPLKSLRGLMNIARLETTDTRVHEYLNLMETSVLRLERFINHIMEYSVNSNREHVREKVDLEVLLNEILEDLSHFDKFKQIHLKIDLKSKTLTTDPRRLKIILSNLLTNAIKYHNTGQPSPWIEIASSSEGGDMVIVIADNGQGIAPEHLSRIFDMFYRASEDSEGSGLGLYIVKDAVRRLGGTIEVASEKGRGSRFTLRLPLE